MGTLGGDSSAPYGLNEDGVAVGASNLVKGGPRHAFVWQNGAMQDLGTLGGRFSYAYSVNDDGHVVGYSSVISGPPHAFMWKGDGLIDLGTFQGHRTVAYGINNAGVIVGAADGPTEDRAIIYLNNTWHDLNDLVPPNSEWVLESARSINEKGQIVGRGTKSDGKESAVFLLTPAAELSSVTYVLTARYAQTVSSPLFMQTMTPGPIPTRGRVISEAAAAPVNATEPETSIEAQDAKLRAPDSAIDYTLEELEWRDFEVDAETNYFLQ
jgi:probable HAF family extracellular repeat protein